MGRPNQLWPGERMRAFLAGVLAADKAVDRATAERLAAALEQRINRMLVADDDPCPSAKPDPDGQAGAPETPTKPTPAPQEFDPYAFSALTVLAKKGRKALLKRLGEIRSPAHLRLLAEAQHIGVGTSAKSAEELREAIANGVEQRLADRKAAAS